LTAVIKPITERRKNLQMGKNK